MIRINKDVGWSLIPGPFPWTQGLYSTCISEKHSFDKVAVSDLIRRLNSEKGVVKTSEGEKIYWDYEYEFRFADGIIGFDVTLFEEPANTWGGSLFWGQFSADAFCHFWAIFEVLSPNVKVHSPECEILLRDDFIERWAVNRSPE
jgi:hypothetical protein